MTETKELTVQDRAVKALGLANLKDELAALAKKSEKLTQITNQDAYQQVHASRMVLKNQRVEISKRGKAARDDANAFSKAVIEEEKKLIGLIQPEEDRLQALQKEHDDHEERERQAKIEAETARVEEIQSRINSARAGVDAIISSPRGSTEIADYIDLVRNKPPGRDFEEFQQQAHDAWTAGIVRLEAHHAAVVAREAEQAKIAAEREELAKLRAAEEKRQAEEKAKREAAEAEARKAREAEEKKQREELEAERKKLDEERASIDAENKRIADERAATEKAKREAEAKRAAEEKAAKKAKYPGDAAIIAALSKAFDVKPDTVAGWLSMFGSKAA